MRLQDVVAQHWREPRARLLAAAVVLVPVAILVVLALRSPREASFQPLRGAITVTQSLSPSTALFGDVLEAEIGVYTEDGLVDPASVRVLTDFRPYEPVSTTVERVRQGDVSLLRTRVSLDCLTEECLAPRDTGRLVRFRPLRVSYRQGSRGHGLQRPWGAVRVYSRLGPRPRLVETPPVLDGGFRLSPEVAQLTLLLLAAGLALLGGWWVMTGFWPRFPYSMRGWRRLSPLEQALAQLDAASHIDDEETRRRVLDQLATRLGERDLVALEGRSRALAWGEAAPEQGELEVLGDQVRGSLNGGSRR